MVRWDYSGIRPLYDDGASKAQEATRDYVLKLDQGEGQAPLLSVFGGKITTFRKLAEAALAKIAPFFPEAGPSWTAKAPLPGGDFPYSEVEARTAELIRKYSFMSPRDVTRMFRAYGTATEMIFDGARFKEDMGESFGSLTSREIDYLVANEWAVTADDILWRRSKLGLHLTPAEQEKLRHHLDPAATRKAETA
jgi:glycerol-3-phosphate dehydrogenase